MTKVIRSSGNSRCKRLISFDQGMLAYIDGKVVKDVLKVTINDR